MAGIEYRTRPPGSQNKGGGDWLEKAVKQALGNIEDQPDAQARLAMALQKNYGIPLEILTPALPRLGEGMRELEAAQEEALAAREAAQAQAHGEGSTMVLEPQDTPQEEPQNQMSETPQPRVNETPPKPTPDQLIGFLEEIMEYTGDDMTLGELHDWAGENTDILDTAIMLKF